LSDIFCSENLGSSREGMQNVGGDSLAGKGYRRTHVTHCMQT